jgi:hypothetical protein
MNYDCFEYKPIQEEPRPLQDGWEARGQLLSVFCRDGFAVASFAWGCCALPEELEPRLSELIGREIGILRLDGYHLREA